MLAGGQNFFADPLEHINNIQHAAEDLSKMDIPRLTKIHGAR